MNYLELNKKHKARFNEGKVLPLDWYVKRALLAKKASKISDELAHDANSNRGLL